MIVVPIPWGVVVAKGAAAKLLRKAVPATTAKHPGMGITLIWALWIGYHPLSGTIFIVGIKVPILTPFIHISAHIKKPQFIRSFLADLFGFPI